MKIHRDELLGCLPPEWPGDVWPAIQKSVAQAAKTVVVFDDDPTGCQTVHGVPLIMDWTVEAFAAEIERGCSLFYILTNTRSMSRDEAASINRIATENLAAAARAAGIDFCIISRGDSTLRGHFPAETDAIAEGLGYVPDAVLLIPNFADGGRITCGDIHYVAEGEWFVPAGETEFARDPSFGFQSSNLRDWVAEHCPEAQTVHSISIEDIRCGGPMRVVDLLRDLPLGAICIINAVTRKDLEAATAGILAAEQDGSRRFFYRTAASFVPTRAALSPQPLLNAATLGLDGSGGGLIIAGSHVAKTTGQLQALRASRPIMEVILDAAIVQGNEADAEIRRIIAAIDNALSEGQDVLVQTSRSLVMGETPTENLAIARRVSDALSTAVRGLVCRPRYIIAKGGITSHDIATKALGAKRVEVLGQAAPGVPVWRLGPETTMPGSAYIVFPGNVGDEGTLARIVEELGVSNTLAR